MQKRYSSVVGAFCLFLISLPALAQSPAQYQPAPAVAPGEQVPAGLPGPQGFRQLVVNAKLRLSLEDAIRLALANNTDIRLDRSPIGNAEDAVVRSRAPFDPALTSNFNASRATSPTFTQLSGAPTLSSLSQNIGTGYAQTLETGTSYQASLGANKLSSNSSFNFFNPSVSANFSFGFSQPLLRGRGLYLNRAPIVIAQRNLLQARSNFEAEVSGIIQQVVGQYWNVVEARENLVVQQKSVAEAQQSYDHDKRALALGALPPLDIYRSESQVAQRRVAEIQSEYSLKLAEDQFRRVIGADIDPYIGALDLDLTENPQPVGALISIDIAAALEKALAYRPEVEALRQQLANDDTSVRVARNGLEPNLVLSGTYQSYGLGGNELNTVLSPPQIISRGGFGDALGQVFQFGFPGYGFGLSLSLPIRNHAAEANLADSLVTQRHDLYSDRKLRETIELDVANSVHELEQSKLSMEAAKVSLDLAQKNLQAEQRKYDLGAEQIYFVLEAQTELAQAEQSLVQAEVGYQLAVTAVDYATGGLLKRYRVQFATLSR